MVFNIKENWQKTHEKKAFLVALIDLESKILAIFSIRVIAKYNGVIH